MTNRNRMEVWLFIVPCFVLTGILAFLERICVPIELERGTKVFAVLACMMPAVTALIICGIKKIEIKELSIFPKLRENKLTYVAFILISILVALLAQPLTALFFPKIVKFQDFDPVVFSASVLMLLAVALLSMVTLLGEEIGWIGYLFKRLEKLYGPVWGTVLMAVVRGAWHLVLYAAIGADDIFRTVVLILISNLLTDSLLVYSYKKTSSVVPAAIMHAITNVLPGAYAAYVIADEVLLEKNFLQVQAVSLLPAMVVGIVCYGGIRNDR